MRGGRVKAHLGRNPLLDTPGVFRLRPAAASSVAKPREPPRRPPAVRGVVVAEPLRQRGLFVEDYEEMKHDRHHRAVDEDVQRAEQDRPPEDDREHAEVHGITHVAVQAADDELLRRVDGGRRGASEGGEIPHAPRVRRGAHEEERQGEQHRPPRRGRARPGDGQRHEDGHRTRDNERKKQVLQQQRHGHRPCSSGPPNPPSRSAVPQEIMVQLPPNCERPP